jgi:hypothetical protein
MFRAAATVERRRNSITVELNNIYPAGDPNENNTTGLNFSRTTDKLHSSTFQQNPQHPLRVSEKIACDLEMVSVLIGDLG